MIYFFCVWLFWFSNSNFYSLYDLKILEWKNQNHYADSNLDLTNKYNAAYCAEIYRASLVNNGHRLSQVAILMMASYFNFMDENTLSILMPKQIGIIYTVFFSSQNPKKTGYMKYKIYHFLGIQTSKKRPTKKSKTLLVFETQGVETHGHAPLPYALFGLAKSSQKRANPIWLLW